MGLRRSVTRIPGTLAFVVFVDFAVPILDCRPFLPLRERLTPEAQNFFWVSQLSQAVKRRSNRVEWVASPKRLRNHVVGAHQLNHRANSATCNDSCSIDRRLEQHMLAAEQSMHFMRNRSPLERDVDQMLLGLFDGLGDGYRDFGGFSFADPDPAMSVSDYDQGAEVKTFAAFHHLGHTVDEDHLVFQAQLISINSHAVPRFFLSHTHIGGSYGLTVLELKAPFTGRFRKGLDPTVIHAATTIKHHGAYLGGFGTISQQFAYSLGRVDAAGRFQGCTQRFIERRCSGNSGPLQIVDNLRIDMRAASKHI